MRFSLQDVRRQIRRRDSELTVALHFLRPGELRAEIARLVAYYEGRCGQPRRNFAQDEASTLVGDYRMARCLLPVLSAWYSWRQPAWIEALGELSEQARVALNKAEIRSSVALRLALFDYVNAHYSGFLTEQVRSIALSAFASLYHLDLARLEYLLALDTEDEAVLVREATAPPEVDAVAALYNQWVFEAALFNASEVRFVVDCEAFLEARRRQSPEAPTGLGAVVKRLCYLARKLGVYYDLAYEPTLPGARSTLLHLTLYGPQEMTGSPQQYGQRLARLCRSLFLQSSQTGAQRARGTAGNPGLRQYTGGENARSESSFAYTRERRQTAGALARAILRAEADVHIFQNVYRFQMESDLLALLSAPEQSDDETLQASGGRVVAESALVYDSGVEQSFAGAFAALERGNGVDGWQLEREPEPLLFSTSSDLAHAGGIFIPDFALTRGEQRVYVEILGFWTPAYRERKVQKLHFLRGRADLILALPVEARPAFAALAADFPLIEYRDQLSATELLRILQTRYNDFAERLAGLDRVRVQTALQEASFVPERACYKLLNCYRRAELARATASVLVPGMAYTPGLGLYLLTWLEHIHAWFVEWIEAKGQYKLPLSDIIQECQLRWPELTGCDENAIEILFTLWPEVRVQRDSIFEARLIVEARGKLELADTSGGESVERATSVSSRRARERRSGSKKHPRQETGQQSLFSVS